MLSVKNMGLLEDVRLGSKDALSDDSENSDKKINALRFILILIFITGFFSVMGYTAWVSGAPELYEANQLEEDMFEAINEVREEHGLEPVEWDEEVAEVSRSHSRDMGENNFFEHETPRGESPKDRLDDANIFTLSHGEILLELSDFIPVGGQVPLPRGHEDMIEDGIELWMNSDSHREAILEESYEKVGIGVYNDGDHHTYFTAMFVTKP